MPIAKIIRHNPNDNKIRFFRGDDVIIPVDAELTEYDVLKLTVRESADPVSTLVLEKTVAASEIPLTSEETEAINAGAYSARIQLITVEAETEYKKTVFPELNTVPDKSDKWDNFIVKNAP